MKEEFKKLLELFKEGFNGNGSSVDAVIKESLVLFDRMKHSLYESSDEEKQYLVNCMTEFYNDLMVEAKKQAQSMGVSEDQLFATTENQSEFTPEQWQKMQETKNQLLKASMGMYEAIKPTALNFNALKKNAATAPSRPKITRPSCKEEWLRS